MRKKDYQLIAECLLEARRGVFGSPAFVATVLLGIDSVQSELVRALRANNVHFESERFAQAAAGE